MGHGEGGVALPLLTVFVASVVTLVVFYLWSNKNKGKGSRGTTFVEENGKPVRRSTRLAFQWPFPPHRKTYAGWWPLWAR